MKTLLLSALTLALSANLFGQAVPNGTFENWSSISYEEPNVWFSGNFRTVQEIGVASVTKVAGYSGNAVRIETKVVSGDTVEAFIANTYPGCSDPSQWVGGVAFNQQPTAITGYYRYNIPGNDTALLLVIFKKNFSVVGNNLIKIKGTGSQSTWASFSFPIAVSTTPDTMIIAATSSNLISQAGIQNGSFLELDNLAFAGATQIIPGGNFESWNPKSFDTPSGWEGWSMNETGITKSTSSYAGTYALRLETVLDECGGAEASGITNGKMTDNGPIGGSPYTLTNDTLCGWYKYTSMGNDTASIFVSLSANGINIGGNNKWLTASSNYIYFELPFQAFSNPDTIRINLESSKWPVTLTNAGSILYVDNLYLKSSALGVFEQTAIESSIYPNPVKEILSIQFGKNISGTLNFFIYDETGRKVETSEMSRSVNSVRIDVSNLASGLYFYEIRTAEGITRNKFIKE